jgi:cell shape-determining protein MreC
MSEELKRHVNLAHLDTELCELWDRIRDLEQGMEQLKRELQTLKDFQVVEKWRRKRFEA